MNYKKSMHVSGETTNPENTRGKRYGTTRREEEERLKEVIAVAEENKQKTAATIKEYKDTLYDLLETYGAKDHEGLAMWHNTQALMLEAERDYVRCEKARKKPYFGRIDFCDEAGKEEESFYIGRVGIARNSADLEVIDWRAPIASVYYESNMGPCNYTVKNEATYEIDLKRKRTYEIKDDELKDYYDSDVVANDELLTKYLAKSKKAVLGEIIATIQKEQNNIIRKSPKTNVLVQGCAGSGKTTVAMHRISYILYNYEDDFRPEDFYIVGSNRILLNYITSVLPDLDVYGIKQMTMEQLFVRLLYEDWNPNKHQIHMIEKGDADVAIKGTDEWFQQLADFCERYEQTQIPCEEIRLEKNQELLIGPNIIQTYLQENKQMSMQAKIGMLNEILLAKLENLVQGKNVSFKASEKKELERKYATYFGKEEWKGNLFALYEKFLLEQIEKGARIRMPRDSFDVYDLAALAYLYKRIKEIDPIREASHVVIDEAQDFGMMAYQSLYYCMRGCTYTIMGDVSQNIHFGYGLNDWEALRKLILKGTYDSFGLLKKSYRNTIEISNFATDILKHGSFSIYPVEPIVRHGNEVRVNRCKDRSDLLEEMVRTIQNWQQEGHETIAIVTRDEKEAQKVTEELEKYITLADSNLETAEFGNGVMVLPVAYTKGLEFDAVLLFNPSIKKYPNEDAHVKLLYVAATRALHELCVLHLGNLSEIIATKAPEGKSMEHLREYEETVRIFQKEEKTTEEQKKELAQDAHKEMARRAHIGPQRIVVSNKKNLDNTYTLFPKEAGIRKIQRSIGNSTPTDVEKALAKHQKQVQAKERVVRDTKVAEREYENAPINPSVHPFGAMPDTAGLRVPGHGKVDCAVRWVKKSKAFVDIASNYGTLRVQPVTDTLVRIRFRRGQIGEFQAEYPGFAPEVVQTHKFIQDKAADTSKPVAKGGKENPGKEGENNAPTWNVKESTGYVELSMKYFLIKCEKRTGALQFLDKSGKLILEEKATEPRLLEERGKRGWYVFFNFAKNEKLDARGILATDFNRVTMKAKYISFGQKPLRMPWLRSEKGYQLGIAATQGVVCCDIPMYGSYVHAEEMEEIDYYFSVR